MFPSNPEGKACRRAFQRPSFSYSYQTFTLDTRQMMTTLEIPSVLSSSQRRCQVLLMLYLPDAAVTAQSIIAANGVER